MRTLPWKRLLMPAVCVGIVVVALELFSSFPAAQGRGWSRVLVPLLEAAAWLSIAWLGLRSLELFLWKGVFERRMGRPVPRLLTGLTSFIVWVVALLAITAAIFEMPVAGIVTTSGVAVAVLGFALRDMLASLFSGVAASLEGSYEIGDWLELDPDTTGRVEQVSWLTTRLVTKDRVRLVIPNAEFASRRFRNYGRRGRWFRDQFTVPLDHLLDPDRVERVLRAAAAEVAPGPPAPDIKIASFEESGTRWLVRYWLDDYARLPEIRHAVKRAVLRHLRVAGIALPYAKLDLYHARMPPRELAYGAHLDRLLARTELFADLGEDDLRALAAAASPHLVREGETVIRLGEPGRSLFVVMEGVCEAWVIGPDGAQVCINTLVAGDMFGEFSLLTGEPRSATIRARTDCLLYEIDRDALAPVLQRNPQLAEKLSEVLARRQERLHRLAREGAPVPAREPSRQRSLLRKIRGLFGLDDT